MLLYIFKLKRLQVKKIKITIKFKLHLRIYNTNLNWKVKKIRQLAQLWKLNDSSITVFILYIFYMLFFFNYVIVCRQCTVKNVLITF